MRRYQVQRLHEEQVSLEMVGKYLLYCQVLTWYLLRP